MRGKWRRRNVGRVRQLASNPTKGVNVLAVGGNLLHQKTTITVVYSSPTGERICGRTMQFVASPDIPPQRGRLGGVQYKIVPPLTPPTGGECP